MTKLKKRKTPLKIKHRNPSVSNEEMREQALGKLRNLRMGMFFFRNPYMLNMLKGDIKDFEESGLWYIRAPLSAPEAKNILAIISIVTQKIEK